MKPRPFRSCIVTLAVALLASFAAAAAADPAPPTPVPARTAEAWGLQAITEIDGLATPEERCIQMLSYLTPALAFDSPAAHSAIAAAAVLARGMEPGFRRDGRLRDCAEAAAKIDDAALAESLAGEIEDEWTAAMARLSIGEGFIARGDYQNARSFVLASWRHGGEMEMEIAAANYGYALAYIGEEATARALLARSPDRFVKAKMQRALCVGAAIAGRYEDATLWMNQLLPTFAQSPGEMDATAEYFQRAGAWQALAVALPPLPTANQVLVAHLKTADSRAVWQALALDPVVTIDRRVALYAALLEEDAKEGRWEAAAALATLSPIENLAAEITFTWHPSVARLALLDALPAELRPTLAGPVIDRIGRDLASLGRSAGIAFRDTLMASGYVEEADALTKTCSIPRSDDPLTPRAKGLLRQGKLDAAIAVMAKPTRKTQGSDLTLFLLLASNQVEAAETQVAQRFGKDAARVPVADWPKDLCERVLRFDPVAILPQYRLWQKHEPFDFDIARATVRGLLAHGRMDELPGLIAGIDMQRSRDAWRGLASKCYEEQNDLTAARSWLAAMESADSRANRLRELAERAAVKTPPDWETATALYAQIDWVSKPRSYITCGLHLAAGGQLDAARQQLQRAMATLTPTTRAYDLADWVRLAYAVDDRAAGRRLATWPNADGEVINGHAELLAWALRDGAPAADLTALLSRREGYERQKIITAAVANAMDADPKLDLVACLARLTEPYDRVWFCLGVIQTLRDAEQ